MRSPSPRSRRAGATGRGRPSRTHRRPRSRPPTGCSGRRARDRPGLEAAGHGAKMVHLPAFLDAGPAPPARPACDPPRLLTVAMMRPGDKLESYRRLAAGLAQLAGDWRLEVIGDGEAKGEVRALLAPFGDRVAFRGRVDDPAALRAAPRGGRPDGLAGRRRGRRHGVARGRGRGAAGDRRGPPGRARDRRAGRWWRRATRPALRERSRRRWPSAARRAARRRGRGSRRGTGWTRRQASCAAG